jgi:Flp pilus assembly protein CpaB
MFDCASQAQARSSKRHNRSAFSLARGRYLNLPLVIFRLHNDDKGETAMQKQGFSVVIITNINLNLGKGLGSDTVSQELWRSYNPGSKNSISSSAA